MEPEQTIRIIPTKAMSNPQGGGGLFWIAARRWEGYSNLQQRAATHRSEKTDQKTCWLSSTLLAHFHFHGVIIAQLLATQNIPATHQDKGSRWQYQGSARELLVQGVNENLRCSLSLQVLGLVDQQCCFSLGV